MADLPPTLHESVVAGSDRARRDDRPAEPCDRAPPRTSPSLAPTVMDSKACIWRTFAPAPRNIHSALVVQYCSVVLSSPVAAIQRKLRPKTKKLLRPTLPSQLRQRAGRSHTVCCKCRHSDGPKCCNDDLLFLCHRRKIHSQ